MKRALKFLVSAALVILAFRLLDLETIAKTIRGGSAASLVLAIGINLLTFLALGGRWYWMVSTYVRARFRPQLAIYLKATFLNTFTPANLGGDLYRIAVLKSDVLPASNLLKLLIKERLLGLYSCLIVFALAWLWLPLPNRFDISNPYTWGIMLALAAFAAPLFAQPFGELLKTAGRRHLGPHRLPQLERWIDTGAGLFAAGGTLKLMLISFVVMLMWVLSIKVVAAGFGLTVPFMHLAAVATLVEIVRLLPLTIQGIGLREGVFAYLLNLLGHDPGQGYAVGVIVYLALSVSIVLAGPAGNAMDTLAKK